MNHKLAQTNLRKVGVISFIDYQTVKFSASEEDLLDQVREGEIDHLNGLDQYYITYLNACTGTILKAVSIGLSEHTMGFGEVGKLFESIIVTTVPLGTVTGRDFKPGISDLPPVGSVVYECPQYVLHSLFDDGNRFQICLGSLLGYPDVCPSIAIDSLLANHAAVLGNTGAGKSTTTRAFLSQLQESYLSHVIREDARVVVLDVHGDYSGITTSGRYSFESLYLPVGLLSKEDWYSILSPSERVQKPLLERGLEYSHLNDQGQKFLCAALAEFAIRDPSQDSSGSRWIQVNKYFSRIANDLTSTYEYQRYAAGKKFSLKSGDIIINAPHDLMRCFRLDFGNYPQGLLDTIHAVLQGYLRRYLGPDGMPSTKLIASDEDLLLEESDIQIENIMAGVEFVFEEEQVKGNRQSRAYSEGLVTRLKNFSSKYERIILRWEQNKNDLAEIADQAKGVTVINLSGEVDSDGLRLVSSFLARRLLESNKAVQFKERKPTTLLLEEAHRYVLETEGDEESVFERIAREGRKFGVYLMVVSQIPSELSRVVLSQCGLFIIHRIQNQADLQFLSKNVPSMNPTQLVRLPTFAPGSAAVFGSAIPVPFEVAINGRGFSEATPSVSFLANKK
jgi:DNA helicase HerA-like ATPase